MKKRRQIFLLISGLLILIYGFWGSAQAISSERNSAKTHQSVKKKTLVIGLEGTYPPYSYRKNKKLTGFEVDLGRKVAEEMGMKAKFVPTKWDSLVAGLGARKFDVIMNDITQTPERAKQYSFSVPYIKSHYILIVPTDSSIKNLEQIKDKKMAQSTGTNNAMVAKKFGAKVVPDEDFASSLDMIRQGRVDGTINNREAWFAYKKKGSVKGLKIIDVSKQEEPVKISALFNKKSSELQASYNRAMRKLQKDGTVSRLSMKYFGADISK